MNRSLLICLVFVLSPLWALSQQAQDSLMVEQSAEFKRLKMTIDLEGVDMTSYGNLFSCAEFNISKKWKAYQGWQPLSEWDFFRIANYPDPSVKARAFRDNAYNEMLVGIMGAVAGVFLMITSSGDKTEYDPILGEIKTPYFKTVRFAIGTVITTGGGTLFWDGIVKRHRNCYPYSLAAKVAEEFNTKLRKRLQEMPNQKR